MKLRGALPVGYLTEMEVIVLREIALGLGNHRIASERGISIKTVEKHRANTMRKLGTNGTADLVRAAVRLGVIGIPVRPLEETRVAGPGGMHTRWMIPT